MASKDFSNIPTFYRLYFSWLDPAVCVWGSYMDFFTPAFVVAATLPPSISPHNTYYDWVLYQLGGALLSILVIDVVLLRYTNDINIWKIWEVAVLVYDLGLLYSFYRALELQGRLSFGALRFEDWGAIVITAQAAVVRSAFILGVGLSASGSRRGKKRA